MVTELQRRLLQIPGVTHVGSHIGQALLGEEIAGPEFSEQWITLSPHANLDKTSRGRTRGRRLVPRHVPRSDQLPARAHRRDDLEHERGSRRCASSGPDFGTLQRLANEITTALNGTPGPGRPPSPVPGLHSPDPGDRERARGGPLRADAGCRSARRRGDAGQRRGRGDRQRRNRARRVGLQRSVGPQQPDRCQPSADRHSRRRPRPAWARSPA